MVSPRKVEKPDDRGVPALHRRRAAARRDMLRGLVRQRLALLAATLVGLFLLVAAVLFALARSLGQHHP
jgi:hypothetical protein